MDGSITIDTAIDREGFVHGTQKMEQATNNLLNTVNNAGKSMYDAIQAVNPALRNLSHEHNQISENLDSTGFGKSMAEMQKQAGSIANQLSKLGDAENLGVKTEAQMARFSLGVTKARESLVALIDEMGKLANQPVNTDQWKELEDEFNRLDAELEKLYRKQDILNNRGVNKNSSSYRELVADIEWLGKEQERVLAKRKELESSDKYANLAGDTEQYQEMEAKIKELIARLEHYQEVVQSFSGGSFLSDITPSANQATEALKKTDQELQQKPKDAGMATQALTSFGQGLLSIANNASKITWNVLSNGARMAGAALQKVATTIPKIAWNTAITGAKNAGNALVNGAKAAGSGISALIGKLRSLGNQSNKNVLTNNGLVKSLFSVKRMLLSRIKRTFISSIFNSMKEGMNSLAKYSSSFNAAMSGMKNSMSGLSGNLAVAASNLINAIAPAITTIIDWISKAMSYVNAFFALLSGKTTYTVAKKGTEDYAKSLDKSKKSATGASNAVKDLKEQVYGFDELNKESDKNNTANNGNTNAANNGIEFEERELKQLPTNISEMFDRIKKALAGEEWEKIGQIAAEGLNSIISSVDKWIIDTLEPKATKWADRIAQILNGLVSGFNWNNAGKLVGDGINTIVNIISTFLSKFNFEELGKGFAEGINSIISTVNWTHLGHTIALKFNAAINLLHGAIANVNWNAMADSIAKGINGFLSGVEWTKLILTAWLGMKRIIFTIGDVIENIKFDEWSAKIGEGLNKIFDKKQWELLGAKISVSFNKIIKDLNTLIQDIPWDKMSESIAAGVNGLLNGIDWTNLIATVANGLLKIRKAFWSFVSLLNLPGLTGKIVEAVNNLFTSEDSEKAFKASNDAVAKGINSLIDSFGAIVDPEKGIKFIDISEKIGSGVNDLLGQVKWSDLVKNILTGGALIIASFGAFMKKLNLENIANQIANGINSFFTQDGKNVLVKAAEEAGEGLQSIIDAFSGFLENLNLQAVRTSISQGINQLVSKVAIGRVITRIGNFVVDAANEFSKLVSEIRFDTIARDIANGLSNIFKADDDTADTKRFEMLGRNLSDAVKNAISSISTFFEEADWLAMGESIGAALGSIDWLGIAGKIVEFLWNALLAVVKTTGGLLGQFVTTLFGLETVDTFDAAGTAWAQQIYDSYISTLSDGEKSAQQRTLQAAALIASGTTDEMVRVLADGSTEIYNQTADCVYSIVHAIENEDGSQLYSAFAQFGLQAPQGFIDAVNEGLLDPAAVENISQHANDLLLAVADATNAQGVIDAFAQYGIDIPDALAEKLAQAQRPVADSGRHLLYALQQAAKDKNLDEAKQAFADAGITISDSFADSILSFGLENMSAALMLLGAGVDQATVEAMDMSHLSENLNAYMNETGKDLTTIATELGAQVGDGIGYTIPDAIAHALGIGTAEVERVKGEMVEKASATTAEVTAAKEKGANLGAGSVESVTAGIQKETGNVQSAAETATEAITNPFKGLPAETEAQALLMMQAVQTAISNGEPKATAAIKVAADAVIKCASKILNGGEGKTIGTAFIKEIIDGLTDMQDTVIAQMETIANTIRDRAKDRLSARNGKTIGYTFLNSMLEGLKSVQSSLLTTAQNIAGNVYGAFSGLLTHSAGYSMGAQICNGLVSGLYRNESYVTAAAWNVAMDALDSAKAALGISSPSKEFTEVGGYAMEGLENGLLNGQKNVNRTISNIANGMVNGFSDTPTLTVAADAMTKGLDGVTNRLDHLASTFTAIADTISSLGGFSVPDVAAGRFTPYKARVEAGSDSGASYGALTSDLKKYQSDIGEDMSDIRGLIRELINVIRNKNTNIDAKSLERLFNGLTRDRIQSYGGV